MWSWSTLVLIGLAVVLIAAVLWSRSKVNIKVEPFGNRSDASAKEVEAEVEKMRDAVKGPLNLQDNQSSFENIIMAYNKWAGYQMLDILGDPKKIKENVKMFNDLALFRDNLNVAMKFLDNNTEA